MCIYCMNNLRNENNSIINDERGPIKTLARVNLCRVDLALFRKHFRKPECYKNYFSESRSRTGNTEDNDTQPIEDSHVESTINDIMNYIRHPKDEHCGDNDFEKREAGIDRNLIVFVRETNSADALLLHLRVKHLEQTNYSKLVFLPLLKADKSLEALYVMSGGQAWRAIYKIADFKFLASVPLKIADPEGAKCHEVHCLVGEYKSKACIKKVPDNLGDLDVGEVCTKFTAKVSKTIINGIKKPIQEFLFPSIDIKKPVTLKVTEGSLTFTAKVSISEVKKLVRSLEDVYKDDSNKFPIPEDTKLQRLVLRVTKEKEQELNEELKVRLNQHIFDCLSNSELLEHGLFSDFEIRHQLEHEYVETSKATLTFEKKTKSFSSKPSFSDLIQFLLKQSQNIKEETDVLNSFQISFKGKKARKHTDTLFSFMTGNFYSENDDEYYWLLHKTWYFVSEDMLLDVQRKFQNILKDHLMLFDASNGRASAPALYLPWDIKNNILSDEGEYNQKYHKEENYFNGDKSKINNIEICDVCYYIPNEKTYLYHVKRMKGNMTRVVCSQLTNSAKLLKDLQSSKFNPATTKKLKDYGKEVFGAELDKTTEILGMNPEKKITRVFVLGLQTHTDLTESLSHEEIVSRSCDSMTKRIRIHSLRAEMDLERNLSEAYVNSYIKRHDDFRCVLERANYSVNMLIQKLCELGYLKQKQYSTESFVWEVTPMLLFLQYNAYKNFKKLLPETPKLSEDDQNLFCKRMKLMLQVYCTYFASYGTKMDIIRCKNFVSTQVNNVIDQFKICEILVKAPEIPVGGKNKEIEIENTDSEPKIQGQANAKKIVTPRTVPIRNLPKLDKGPMDKYTKSKVLQETSQQNAIASSSTCATSSLTLNPPSVVTNPNHQTQQSLPAGNAVTNSQMPTQLIDATDQEQT